MKRSRTHLREPKPHPDERPARLRRGGAFQEQYRQLSRYESIQYHSRPLRVRTHAVVLQIIQLSLAEEVAAYERDLCSKSVNNAAPASK